MRYLKFHALALASLLALAACGGGGGSSGGDGGSSLPVPDTSSVAAADPGSTLPEGWQHGVFMEIYVRGYQDSNGDGKGDLQGLIGRLDYLKSLGVSGIWLMPVSQSQDHDHGYAVADYRAVETDYGSLADLDALVTQAHARGIGVILDYVMNHSGSQHPLFQQSRSAKDNAWRNWYVWQDSAPSGWSVYGGNPWRSTGTGAYYGPFSDQMPDFNLKNSATFAWHQDNLRFWLNRGVDGFRFDAVGNLVENGPNAWENQPENPVLMGTVRNSVLAAYQRRYMVCEAPANPALYQGDEACGSAFAFGHQSHLVGAAQGNSTAVASLALDYASGSAGSAWFASNHDSFAGQRLWDQLGGDDTKLRLAAGTYLLQRGTPFVYYGEEIGLAGASSLSGDAALRTPMSWSTDAHAGFSTASPFRALSANATTRNVTGQQADANSLLHFYQAMLALRTAMPVLAQGSTTATASGSVLQLRRTLGSEQALQLVNYGSSAATFTLTGLPASATLQAKWPAGGADVAVNSSGQVTLTVPAQAMQVWRVGP